MAAQQKLNVAYVRWKTIHDRRYAYLVRSERHGDKVRQVFIAYLGPACSDEDNVRAIRAYEEGRLPRKKVVSVYDLARALETSAKNPVFRHYILPAILEAYLHDWEDGIASTTPGGVRRFSEAICQTVLDKELA